MTSKKQTQMNKVRETLAAAISKNPTNLAAAFRHTALKHKTTFDAVRGQWYNKGGMRDSAPLFFTKTSEGMVLNKKVSKVIKCNTRTLELKGEMLDVSVLTDKDKVELFDLLVG